MKTYVSAEIAQQTDQWEVYDAQKLVAPRPQIYIDGRKLREHVSEYEQFYADLTNQLCRRGQTIDQSVL